MVDLGGCMASAQSLGFSGSSAQFMCGYFQRESQFAPDVPCTCSTDANANIPANWIHGYAACKNAGLDPHCGFGQWSELGFGSIYQAPGCLGDLTCELSYAKQVSNGGSCFKPWNPGQQCSPTYDPPFSGGGSGSADGPGGGGGGGGGGNATQGQQGGGSCHCPPDAPFHVAGQCLGPLGPVPCKFVQEGAAALGKCAPWDVQCLVTEAIKTLKKPAETVGLLVFGALLMMVGIVVVARSNSG